MQSNKVKRTMTKHQIQVMEELVKQFFSNIFVLVPKNISEADRIKMVKEENLHKTDLDYKDQDSI